MSALYRNALLEDGPMCLRCGAQVELPADYCRPCESAYRLTKLEGLKDVGILLMRARESGVFNADTELAERAIDSLLAAQGIEAQRAETENTGSVADESPVAESDAPNPNHHPTRKG